MHPTTLTLRGRVFSPAIRRPMQTFRYSGSLLNRHGFLGAATAQILDVGCGTGYLLGRLAAGAPQAEVLAGDLRPGGQHDLVRSLGGPAGRAG